MHWNRELIVVGVREPWMFKDVIPRSRIIFYLQSVYR